MFVVLNYFRNYWLTTLILVFGLFSCDTNNVTIEKESQDLNKDLFDTFMFSQFGAKVVLPNGFKLSTYDKSFYKWVYVDKKRVKVTFTDGPDFKGKIFDTQEKQLHITFCELKKHGTLCEALDSVNRVVWRINNARDSLLVSEGKCDSAVFEGKWYLNTKTIGGDCKAKVFKRKNKSLLCYYQTKELGVDNKEMAAIGDSILSTIEFFD